jgi:2-methylisocitrate lyase-like PEP mutase family enzyme
MNYKLYLIEFNMVKEKVQSLAYLLHNTDEIIVAPGIFDGLSAVLTQKYGFKAVYASGGAIARSAGIPDIGLLTLTDLTQKLTEICDICEIPVIADGDTGFGNTLNLRRTVRMFERIGVAAVHFEDQTFPKRCGHLNGKNVVSITEMVSKIKAAVDERISSDFLIIARTDAIAVEGISSAIERGNYYGEAGADIIFIEAPTTVAEIELISKEIKYPKLINMFYGGKTPIVAYNTLKELNFRIVIIPSDLQRASIKAMQTTLQAITQFGDSMSVAESLVSFNQREEIVKTDYYLNLDKIV